MILGPNITGGGLIDSNADNATPLVFGTYGALSSVKQPTPIMYAAYSASKGVNSVGNVTIDAQRSSDLYGKSSTVQPNAVKAMPLIKF